MVFMSLHVSAKFELAVAIEIDGCASNNRTWAEGSGNTRLGWKTIQPEIAGVYHFDNQPIW